VRGSSAYSHWAVVECRSRRLMSMLSRGSSDWSPAAASTSAGCSHWPMPGRGQVNNDPQRSTWAAFLSDKRPGACIPLGLGRSGRGSCGSGSLSRRQPSPRTRTWSPRSCRAGQGGRGGAGSLFSQKDSGGGHYGMAASAHEPLLLVAAEQLPDLGRVVGIRDIDVNAVQKLTGVECVSSATLT
jgi:hypothetical protein